MVSRKSFAALLSLHMALLVSASPVQQHVKRELANGTIPETQNTTNLDSSTPQTDAIISSGQTTQDPAATATIGTTQDVNSDQTATATADGTPQTTSISAATGSDWRAVGCYKNSGDNRILPDSAELLHVDSAAMTYPACREACQSSNKVVAGLQYGKECWCGDEVPSLSLRADDKECNMPCSGAEGDMCGGEWRVTVWAHSDAPVAPLMPNVTAENPGTDFNSHALLANDTQPADATASEATSWTGQPGPEPTQDFVTESGVLVTITQNSEGQLQATAPAATGTTEMTGSASGTDTGLAASITGTSTDSGSVATSTGPGPVATDSAASQNLPSDAPTSVVTSTDATSITDAASNTADPAAAAVVTETASAATDTTLFPYNTVITQTEGPVAVMTVVVTDAAQAASISTAMATTTETGQSSVVTAQVTTIPGTTGVTTKEVQTTVPGGETDSIYVWTTTQTVDQGPVTSTIGAAANTDPGAPAPAPTKRGMSDFSDAIESVVSNFAYADEAQAAPST